MYSQALGMVETLGYIAAVEALDVSLKSANVKFAGCELIREGLVTIKVTGDVGAVNASIEAAKTAVNKVGKLISAFVIPRPADDVFKFFCETEKKDMVLKEIQEKPEELEKLECVEKLQELEKPEESEEQEKLDGIEEREDPKESGIKEPDQEESEPEGSENLEKLAPDESNQEQPERVKVDEERKSGSLLEIKQKLERMKVIELRNMARRMNLSSLTKKDIKFGKKKQLIKAILEYYTRRLK
ncbi:propanediol utilization protein PduA [Clostridium coskatii]|uniref:Propanediol utilization protein PduA n=2 Tax=Clostridium coskatii TaxID=1705578 RepID=A0A162LE79_9CLOT|nr:BMC domain-containing protein [Clostridium coskatii]OAA94712.1 Propanediol utilization protein PduA [Clostridium coskatii]OBR93382.1 propanediol utilization protein PduA [Clostridium coskatii]